MTPNKIFAHYCTPFFIRPSLLYLKLNVNFPYRSAAIWLCYVVLYVFVRISQEHCMMVKCFFGLSPYLTENTKQGNIYHGNQHVTHSLTRTELYIYIYIYKQTHYRPGVAQRVLGR